MISPHGLRRQVSPAFTLSEVLVVIALISALAMLMFPVGSRLSTRSDGAKCQNNLRQIASAALQYSVDHAGFLPDRVRWAYTGDSPASILPYLGLSATGQTTESVLTCPAIRKSRYRPTATEWMRSYSINQYATGSGGGDENWITHVKNRGVPLRTIAVDRPAQQAFFMDGTALRDSASESPSSRFSVFQAPDRLAPATGESGVWRTPFIHDDHINVVFLDGHIEMISQARAEAELIGPTNPSPSQAGTSPRTRPFWGTQR